MHGVSHRQAWVRCVVVESMLRSGSGSASMTLIVEAEN